MKNILPKHKERKTCSKTIKELSNKVLFNSHRVYNDDNTFYYLHCLTSLLVKNELERVIAQQPIKFFKKTETSMTWFKVVHVIKH